MRKAIALVIALGLLAGALALPAAAGKKKKKPAAPVATRVERVVEGTYQAPTLIAVGTCTQTDAVGCVQIPSGPGEQYVAATVTDAAGQAVWVQVKGDLDADQFAETLYGSFCGATEAPLKVDPGVELQFWVGIAPDPDDPTGQSGCVPGLATQGTVSATFSNML